MLPYLDSKIPHQITYVSLMKHHSHFDGRSLSNKPTSLIPIPPNSLGLHTEFQLTQAMLLLSIEPDHKNFLSIKTISCIILTGALKNDS